jgi:hypothetical protein
MVRIPRRLGERVEFKAGDRTFVLTRCDTPRPCYNLKDTAVTQRSRFGDLAQIRQDLAHVLEYHRLPPASGQCW